jgi:hypothetical protein
MGARDERAPKFITGPMWALLALVLLICVGGALLPIIGNMTSPGRARQKATLSNMKQLALALHTYAADNDGRLPAQFRTSADLRSALQGYGDLDASVFSTRNPAGGDIVPNDRLAGLAIDSIALPENTALLMETMPWEDRTQTFAFVDGHVRRVTDVALVVLEPMTVQIPLVDTITGPEEQVRMPSETDR